MGASKSELFSQEQNDLADIAKALGHPARIAIVQHLLAVNSCIGNDLVDHLPLAQPTISRHLKELKAVGIIQGSIEGQRVCYCINPERWRVIGNIFDALFARVKGDKNCC